MSSCEMVFSPTPVPSACLDAGTDRMDAAAANPTLRARRDHQPEC